MRYAIPVVLIIAALSGIWWLNQQRQTAPSEPSAEFVTVPQPRAEPRYPLPDPEANPEPLTLLAPAPTEPLEGLEPQEPVPAPELAAAPEPLPSLTDSDPAALESLGALVGAEAVERWVRPEWVISRLVVVVHSLDGIAPPVEIRPLVLLPRAPQVAAEGGDMLYWTEASARRYADLISLLDSASPAEVGAHYRRYYPLFQQAWEELGEPEPWFNDRLVDIIDHLLATPRVELPVELLAWENRYKFAAEALEDESWGRKLLLRSGPDQAALVQNWLRAIRQELTGQAGQL